MVIVLVAVFGGVVVVGGILVALLLPAVGAAREAARRMQCSNNLKQIALAMHNYHAVHDCFPPAYLADEDGNPMHSWRVLLLPYMEGQFIYEQYDFDQPWDSPHNRALAALMPDVYRCPSSSQIASEETCYMMIVGPGTISDGAGATKIEDITDGTSNTIMVVEVDPSVISSNWMEPRDLDATRISHEINDGVNPGIGSQHPHGANVALCDGSVRYLSESMDTEVVEVMITIAGGEVLGGF